MARVKPAHHKKPRKANKIGRNKIKCERYRREGRREANRDRKAAKRRRRTTITPTVSSTTGGSGDSGRSADSL